MTLQDRCSSCGCCRSCNIIKRLLNFAAVITSWASRAHKIAAWVAAAPRFRFVLHLPVGSWMLAALFLAFGIMMRFCYGFLLARPPTPARARAPGNGPAIIIIIGTIPWWPPVAVCSTQRSGPTIRLSGHPESALCGKFSCTGKHFFLVPLLLLELLLFLLHWRRPGKVQSIHLGYPNLWGGRKSAEG